MVDWNSYGELILEEIRDNEHEEVNSKKNPKLVRIWESMGV
jgi:hypothetical protein